MGESWVRAGVEFGVIKLNVYSFNSEFLIKIISNIKYFLALPSMRQLV